MVAWLSRFGNYFSNKNRDDALHCVIGSTMPLEARKNAILGRQRTKRTINNAELIDEKYSQTVPRNIHAWNPINGNRPWPYSYKLGRCRSPLIVFHSRFSASSSIDRNYKSRPILLFENLQQTKLHGWDIMKSQRNAERKQMPCHSLMSFFHGSCDFLDQKRFPLHLLMSLTGNIASGILPSIQNNTAGKLISFSGCIVRSNLTSTAISLYNYITKMLLPVADYFSYMVLSRCDIMGTLCLVELCFLARSVSSFYIYSI